MANSARIVVIANQKGGVAKTTTAINLAASLAIADQRVLVVDMDPQANLTSGLGLKGQATAAGTIYDALTRDLLAAPPDERPSAALLQTALDHLALFPADRDLAGAEIELVAMDAREFRLRQLLEDLRADFDYIFIDTPPSLGLLTLNSLVAADTILIPLNCEYFALEGIADLLSTVERVRASLNPALAIEGVLLTMYDDRTNLGQQVSGNIREFFGDRVYDTVIPRNIRLGEAPSHGLPVILYDARSRGAEAYVALAQEFLARETGVAPDAVAADLAADLVNSTDNAPTPPPEARPASPLPQDPSVDASPAAPRAARIDDADPAAGGRDAGSGGADGQPPRARPTEPPELERVDHSDAEDAESDPGVTHG